LNVAVVVDVQTEVWPTVDEEGGAVALYFKHRPSNLKTTGAVEVVPAEVVVVDSDEAEAVQPKSRFSREKLRHAFRYNQD
jgi:hypothetical protein